MAVLARGQWLRRMRHLEVRGHRRWQREAVLRQARLRQSLSPSSLSHAFVPL